MAMNKKEKDYVEELEIKLALRFTEPVEKDLFPDEDYKIIVNGYSYNSYSQRVEKSCSTKMNHSLSGWDKTTSQNGIKQYSTKIKALKAMRHEMEINFAKALYKIDKLIEAESQQDVAPKV